MLTDTILKGVFSELFSEDEISQRFLPPEKTTKNLSQKIFTTSYLLTRKWHFQDFFTGDLTA